MRSDVLLYLETFVHLVMWRMVQEKSALVRGQVHKRNLQVLIRYIILSYAIILHNVYLHYDIHKSRSGLLCKLVSD